MENSNVILPVIVAGGSGTRLWPLSRQHKPKQFLSLLGQESMLQETLNRLDDKGFLSPYIICNQEHRFLVAEQLRQAGREIGTLLLEPVSRNTAPAIALAALKATEDGADPVLLVLPADHVIRDGEAFHRAIVRAKSLAQRGKLTTFGVVPDCPETGYGYIERGNACGQGWLVRRFVEKPGADRAAEYLSTGRYFWNSGMFMFRASVYLQELATLCPEILAVCRKALAAARQDLDFIRIDEIAFESCPAASIDYAVMEHTRHAAVVSLDAGWSDVGTWAALADAMRIDTQKNCLQGDVLVHQVDNVLVRAEDRLVAAVGVRDLIIVETKDAVLVARKDKVQDVTQIVEQLTAAGREEHIQHREVYRPWGTYDSISVGSRYQVKKIVVKPGAKLSTQKHHHRAEHWIVVTGTARVTRAGDTYLLQENESTYIPIGVVHSLENPGNIPLELIEVQSGTYLGEDDIVRLEDVYGRN